MHIKTPTLQEQKGRGFFFSTLIKSQKCAKFTKIENACNKIKKLQTKNSTPDLLRVCQWKI